MASSALSLRSDNPCWAATPSQCRLDDLLCQIDKRSSILFENTQYLVLNKPPDLRMDGPYPATVHKLLNFWYPSPSLLEKARRLGEAIANNHPNDDEKRLLHQTYSDIHDSKCIDQRDSGLDDTGRNYETSMLLKVVADIHKANDLHDNFLRPCHQLDYATSGLLLVAKSKEAATHVQTMLEARQVEKSYLAIVKGHVVPSDFPAWSAPQQNGSVSKDDSGLSNEEAALREYLQRLEYQYRKSRSKSSKMQRRNQHSPSCAVRTFQGYQPVHSMFQKWKARMSSAATKKAKHNSEDQGVGIMPPRKKKQKSSLLSESDWKRIWEPVDKVVTLSDATCDKDWFRSLEWKNLGNKYIDLKNAMVEAANLHNDILLQASVSKEESHGDDAIGAEDLPTLFRLVEREKVPTETVADTPRNNSEESFYIFCPLAEDNGKFAMVIPSRIATKHPSLPEVVHPKNNSDYDFKPSLTKCTVLQQGFLKLSNDSVIPVTKVRLALLTGRRHQLRIHMLMAKHAIVGDATYGSAISAGIMDESMDHQQSDGGMLCGASHKANNHRNDAGAACSRMCLHAYSLVLPSLLGREDKKDWSAVAPDPFPMDEDGVFSLRQLF
jgi:23S rRNA-/tRNA-specific pseudouridylate synthase